jgi:hypothetical protein
MQRRELFGKMGTGLASVALASLLADDAAAESGVVKPHFAPRAKRVIQIFCPGAASHIDLWEHKPELEKRHGQPMPGLTGVSSFQGGNGNLMRPPWEFVAAGKSGKKISSLLPHLARHVDDLCFVHSLTAKSNTHGPAMLQMNTGFVLDGFPSMGAWATFALGSASRNLPAFVAIPDVRGLPPNGPANWGAGFLPAAFQGTAFNATRPIDNLRSPAGSRAEAENELRGFLDQLNRGHAARYPGHDDLDARLASYALAARMQLAAPEATDLSKESAATQSLYGVDSSNPYEAAYARNALLARRLLEKGVRFVQLYCGASASQVDGLLNWDAHKTLKADYERHVPIFDRPTAALLTDLKRTGLWKDTLVLWTTEFGRMPTNQVGSAGRDHNPNGFTAWMAGAGVKPGFSYGATDEFGYKSVQDVSSIYDFHATVLHLLGYDHKRLTWYHNGIARRLTDVHGEVLRPVLA